MGLSIAKIAVSAATYSIDKPYDYSIPEDLVEQAVPGMRVIVPFGAGNRKSEGVILSLATDSGQKKLKAIDSLLDVAPVLEEEYIRLALWMSDRFFCTVFDAMRAMLPAGMWFKDGVRRTRDKTVSTVVLNAISEDALKLAREKQMIAPRQAAVLQLLAGIGSISLKEVCYITGAQPASVKALEKTGILSIEEREVFRRPSVRISNNLGPIILNDEQDEAFHSLSALLRSGKPEAALLHGVTGSGKTLVYIKLI